MYHYLKHGDTVSFEHQGEPHTGKIHHDTALSWRKELVHSNCEVMEGGALDEQLVAAHNIQRIKLADGTDVPRVGDYIVYEDGNKSLVLEVFENTFLLSRCNYHNMIYGHYHLKEIEARGCKIERAGEKCKECGKPKE